MAKKKIYKLKDYPKKISVADKALNYGDERFIKVCRNRFRKIGIVATDEEIIAMRDNLKAERFPKSKAKAKAKPETKSEKQPEKEAKKPKAEKKTTKKTAEKQ